MRALVSGLLLSVLAALPAASQDFTTLKGHGGPIMGVQVDPASGRVISASFDNSVGLWQGRDPLWLEAHDAAVNTVIFLSPDRAASGGDDFNVILWDLDAGTARRLTGHQGKVAGLAVSPDGALLASASWDGSIGLWPLVAPDGAPRFLQGHGSGVNAVAFGADGAQLFSASADGTVRVWDLASGADRVLVDQGFGVNRLVLGPNEAWLAYGAVDGVTRVIDPVSGAQLYDFSLERRPILAMAHHPATDRLAVGDGHGYIMMIDTDAWRITRDFRAMQRGPVWALDFSADGASILAGGLDDVVYSWPVALLDEFDPAGGAQRQSFLRDPETMPNGERQFMRKCSICHALTPPPSRKAGPTLYDLFGRKAGAIADYPYSDILATSDIIWSDDTIDALFDMGPDHYIPGSRMPMQVIRAETDRQDLIAFLRKATAPGTAPDAGPDKEN